MVHTLLTIDQDPNCRELIKQLAKGSGIDTILEVPCLYDGMRLFSHHQVDLIIMDVLQPAKTGLTFISEMTSEQNPPIIFATFTKAEFHNMNIEKFTRNLGALYTFTKPLHQYSLRRALHDVQFTPTPIASFLG